jgi:hypothetical protein
MPNMNDEGRAEARRTVRSGWLEVMNQDRDGERSEDGADADGRVALPREAQGRIGRHLRQAYGALLSEPLPDRFSKLLEELAKSERSERSE